MSSNTKREAQALSCEIVGDNLQTLDSALSVATKIIAAGYRKTPAPDADETEQTVKQRMLSALLTLTRACERADALGELCSLIDGAMIDRANSVIEEMYQTALAEQPKEQA